MTENLILYIIVGGIGLLIIAAFVVGIEKMIKIVLGNYVLGGICLAASQSLDILISFLRTSPELKFGGMTYETLGNFFGDAKISLVLVLYAVLLVIIYRTSKIHIHLPEDPAMHKGLFVLFVPIAVLSMILTLQIIFVGIHLVTVEQLQFFGTQITHPAFSTFLSLTPVWIFLHGILTVLITSEMKIGLRTGE